MAILRAKACSLRADLSDAALDYLARQPSGNIRELEGTLNRVLAYARLTQQPVAVALIRDALHAPDRPARNVVPCPKIIDAVCTHFDVSRQALGSQTRTKRVATARHIAMYLLRQDSYQPLVSIGRLLGDRDHSTVLYACRKIEREATVIPETEYDIKAIRARFQSTSAS
jgi:chromosomal replication initiator protein